MIQHTAQLVEQEIRKAGNELAVASLAQEVIELNATYREHFDLMRTAAIRAALLAGFTYTDLSNVMGLSRQRIQQLAEMPPQSPGRRPADLDRSDEARALKRRRDGP